jgi:KamA family protein
MKKSPSLDEVILSGGDPLSLPNDMLLQLLEDLSAIDHIVRIRLHSRFLIGIPERLDSELIKGLKKIKKQMIFVLHTNHINEFDSDVWDSLSQILSLKVPILSQSVLLKGVNDQKEALYNLFSSLSNHGVIPYYLHSLDHIVGASHFQVSKQKGKNLIKELRKITSGYCVPRFVEEIPNLKSKSLIV